MSPHAFSAHRTRTWPYPSREFSTGDSLHDYTAIYDVVRSTGLPNCMAARVPIHTTLKVDAWRRYIDVDTDESDLLQYVQFGFPLGYMGPTSPTENIDNHDSATRFPTHVDGFVAAEIGEGALLGPFGAPPFTPWAHVSPIMSRPKAEGGKRRIITDLTFPHNSSINAYVMKNSALGDVRDHTLPSVVDLVKALRSVGPGAYLCTVDIARAYKNFVSDPLDWPLLCLRWRGSYYLDVSMPFGARASSCFMQRVANFIVRVLRDEGVTAIMYLDDLVIIAPSLQVANNHYHRARELLQELGLPEAHDKAQPPAHNVKWLGINVDSLNSLSIPQEKVDDALAAVSRYGAAKSINKRQLQSLIGRLVHVAKCVEPARIFISCLLQGLRAFCDRSYIKVSDDMRADLAWFAEFLAPWNGLSLIPKPTPHKVIQVDACLTGIGATDGTTAYAARVAPDDDPVANITEIEAANIVIALHTFVTDQDAGGHLLVQCDNLPAVQALTTGRAHNPVLAECARAVWLLQARFAFKISFSHIPGAENQVADAMSRAHLSGGYRYLAQDFIQELRLVIVHPCTHILSLMHPPILSRCGMELAGSKGGEQAGTGSSTWHQSCTEVDRGGAHGVLPPIPHGPSLHDRGGRVHLGRVPREQGHFPGHSKKQSVPCQGLHEAGGRVPSGL